MTRLTCQILYSYQNATVCEGLLGVVRPNRRHGSLAIPTILEMTHSTNQMIRSLKEEKKSFSSYQAVREIGHE